MQIKVDGRPTTSTSKRPIFDANLYISKEHANCSYLSNEGEHCFDLHKECAYYVFLQAYYYILLLERKGPAKCK